MTDTNQKTLDITPEDLVQYIKNPLLLGQSASPYAYYQGVLRARSAARGGNVIGGPQVQLDKLNAQVRVLIQRIRTTADNEVSLELAKKCLDQMNRGVQLVDVTLSI